jgi:hypothetical protein
VYETKALVDPGAAIAGSVLFSLASLAVIYHWRKASVLRANARKYGLPPPLPWSAERTEVRKRREMLLEMVGGEVEDGALAAEEGRIEQEESEELARMAEANAGMPSRREALLLVAGRAAAMRSPYEHSPAK